MDSDYVKYLKSEYVSSGIVLYPATHMFSVRIELSTRLDVRNGTDVSISPQGINNWYVSKAELLIRPTFPDQTEISAFVLAQRATENTALTKIYPFL